MLAEVYIVIKLNTLKKYKSLSELQLCFVVKYAWLGQIFDLLALLLLDVL